MTFRWLICNNKLHILFIYLLEVVVVVLVVAVLVVLIVFGGNYKDTFMGFALLGTTFAYEFHIKEISIN